MEIFEPLVKHVLDRVSKTTLFFIASAIQRFVEKGGRVSDSSSGRLGDVK
jgi:hypothetical protein